MEHYICEQTQSNSKHQQLLRDLKSTVEGLLNSQATYLWNIYGGLNRLHVDLEKIFKHGCKGDDNNHSDYWNFILGLEWLQPDAIHFSFSIESECKNNLPAHIKHDRASIWLYRNLEMHSLSQKLCWLLSDKNHLKECYYDYAYLCQDKYAEATLICLRAVELNQPTLISEIKPNLFVSKCSPYHKIHRRCASLPDSHLKNLKKKDRKILNQPSFDTLKEKVSIKPQIKLRTWNSMPNLNCNHKKKCNRWNTPQKNPGQKQITEQEEKIKLYKSKKNGKQIFDSNIVEHTPPDEKIDAMSRSPLRSLASSGPEFSLLGSIAGISGEKYLQNVPKKTFIEDGGMSVMPMATGYFPKPTKGQSLTSYLMSSQLSRGNAELDRENAHFNICEAVIAAMEQLKSSKDVFDSDEEIKDLKQRIRLRRREKLEERQRRLWANSLSDGKTDTTISPASASSSPGVLSENISTDGDEDNLDVDLTSNLQDNTDLSISMASLYSESDIMRRPRGIPDGASDVLSAEGVALCLISKFNEKQLPRASDLEWLVSEEEVPQALLPLPKSWPISPDDANNEQISTALRGTKEWAPPRPQIIFTIHPMPSRKLIMEKQNYRCAGCGTRVALKYATKFRYCNYLGRYFCTGCHTNQVSLIPARIIHQWNFMRYSVSTFSYRLIEKMYTDPLFRIFELNPKIGKQSRNLQICKKFRHGLMYLKDYILRCRLAENIQDLLKSEESYLFNDPDLYSLEDLVRTRTGELKNKLKYIVEICCRHAHECELCTGRGFICEICDAKEVLFPWQMQVVSRCKKCGSCFHLKCWNKDAPCIRCCRKLVRDCENDSQSTFPKC